MSEMHLKQPGFTYTACGPFTRNTERNFCKQKIQVYANRKYKLYLQE